MSSGAKKMAVGATFSLVIAVCVYAGGWYFVRKNEEGVRVRAEAYAAQSLKKRELASLKEVFEDTVEERAALRAFVIEKDGTADFLELVEDSARKLGLTPATRSVTIESVSSSTKFEALAIAFECVGGYAGVSAMLPLIEALPYQVEVRSVSLDRTGNNAQTDEWRGVILLRVIKEKSV